MFKAIRLIGRGRLGSAVAVRLAERGHTLADEGADLVILCVPDGAIAEVAREIDPGPWICHMSGATALGASDPHTRRFSVHPLQTFRSGGGADQFDGAWAAVTGETPDARTRAWWLASELGLRPFTLSDDRRALYHAGATMASNYLVTLYALSARAVAAAGAPPEAIVPLMRRTIDNGFELTGPILRGDWATIEAHVRALEGELPDAVPVYRELARATAEGLAADRSRP